MANKWDRFITNKITTNVTPDPTGLVGVTVDNTRNVLGNGPYTQQDINIKVDGTGVKKLVNQKINDIEVGNGLVKTVNSIIPDANGNVNVVTQTPINKSLMYQLQPTINVIDGTLDIQNNGYNPSTGQVIDDGNMHIKFNNMQLSAGESGITITAKTNFSIQGPFASTSDITNPDENHMYLVGTTSPYYLYVYNGTEFVEVGATDVDLSNYYNKTETDDKLNGKINYSDAKTAVSSTNKIITESDLDDLGVNKLFLHAISLRARIGTNEQGGGCTFLLNSNNEEYTLETLSNELISLGFSQNTAKYYPASGVLKQTTGSVITRGSCRGIQGWSDGTIVMNVIATDDSNTDTSWLNQNIILDSDTVLEIDIPSVAGSAGGVTDVQVDGTSVVTDGVASIDLTGKMNVPTGSIGSSDLLLYDSTNKTLTDSNLHIINSATEFAITSRTQETGIQIIKNSGGVTAALGASTSGEGLILEGNDGTYYNLNSLKNISDFDVFNYGEMTSTQISVYLTGNLASKYTLIVLGESADYPMLIQGTYDEDQNLTVYTNDDDLPTGAMEAMIIDYTTTVPSEMVPYKTIIKASTPASLYLHKLSFTIGGETGTGTTVITDNNSTAYTAETLFTAYPNFPFTIADPVDGLLTAITTSSTACLFDNPNAGQDGTYTVTDTITTL